MPVCRATKRIACRPGVGGAMIPRTCDAAALPGQNNNVGGWGDGRMGRHVQEMLCLLCTVAACYPAVARY